MSNGAAERREQGRQTRAPEGAPSRPRRRGGGADLVCPQCRAKYQPQRATDGRRVRCHHCGHVWRDEGPVLHGVPDALEKAASAWSDLGSTTIRATDHASTMAHLISKTSKQPRPAASEWVGRKLGRYEVKAVLGQGAMGYVYEALDTNLKRTVALKILPRRPESDPESLHLRMFLQEAQVAARLQHPGIVTIYEVGEEEGIHFFAMELVHGQTLLALVRQHGRLPATQACYLIAHAARALAVGHAEGVVHRDVKPGNIMVDTAGRVKVTDFGLADVSEWMDVDRVEELSALALGTPGWISPEVARGEGATAASDIYGLGLTLYYTLTGKRLVRAKTRSGMVRVQRDAKRIRREDLPDDWPPRLQDVVVQCLQVDPKDRYQSADMLAADLLRVFHPNERDGTLVLSDRHAAPPRGVPPVWSWTVLALLFLTAASVATWYYFLR